MADPQQSQIPNAPFPAPPPFWKHFTSENLSRLKALTESNTKPEDVPPDLRYLIPPSPPTDIYTTFGEAHDLSPTPTPLSHRGIQQLYPSNPNSVNHPALLLQLLRSLHLNYLEAMTILSQNPNLIIPKLEDIKNLFLNAHWVINMYRPHQARESLIEMMEREVEDGKREIGRLEEVGEKVKEFLKGVEGEGKIEGGENGRNAVLKAREGAMEEEEEEDAKRLLWKKMLDIDVEAD